MHPLITAVTSSPAFVQAAQATLRDAKPLLDKALRRPNLFWSAGSTAGLATVATTCFAAGLAVGWFTAPSSGAQLRAQASDGLRTWKRWATALVKHDAESPTEGSVTDLEPSEIVGGEEGSPGAPAAASAGVASTGTAAAN